jgi:penicillin-binding protein activator
MRWIIGWAVAALVLTTIGCVDTRPGEGRGRPTVVEDPNTPGRVQGPVLSSEDIISMTDTMMRDILACQKVVSQSNTAPRIVIDSQYFRNESSTPLNKNLLTDRLRVNLNRAAGGRLVFLSRADAAMVEDERTLELQGVVTDGTRGKTKPALGWDFRLSGRIMSQDAKNVKTGEISQYHLVVFELVERGSGAIVWSNSYEVRKSALDDVVNRP